MSTDVDSLLRQARERIDTPTLTALTSGDPRQKPFLLEAIALQGVLFLLEQYCASYLDAVGLGELAERHAKASRKLLARLRGRQVAPEVEDESRRLAEAIAQVRKASANEDARKRAEAAVSSTLTESGVGGVRSRAVASDISALVVPEHDG